MIKDTEELDLKAMKLPESRLSSSQCLLNKYNNKIEQGELTYDSHQQQVLEELQSIYNKVVSQHEEDQNNEQSTNKNVRKTSVKRGAKSNNSTEKRKSFIDKILSWSFKKTPSPQLTSIKGLYIWGGVGRGKTYLVNYFYKELPIEKKLRLHFHRFMQLVHDELDQLDGITDPLKTVAENMANKANVLCLDEIHINDITDAMLLGRLFEHLFNAGIVLITTSNIHPDNLYKNGLQREQFLPAIRLLKHYTTIIEIEGNLDYRLRVLEQNGVYQIVEDQSPEPLPQQGIKQETQKNSSKRWLQDYFDKLSGVDLHKDRASIIINKRHIPVIKWADDIVWFNFDEICNSARSTSDYSQIATFFSTVLISDIPIMDDLQDDAARRFVNMVDEFYDRHVNLIISAAGSPENLYTGKKLAFEFKRTASRLREMQSSDYIAVRN